MIYLPNRRKHFHYPASNLLLHCNGADTSTTFLDSSTGGIGSPHTVTANGNAQIDTAISKFGGASALFDGTTDYLSIPSSADFTLGTGDFTIDFWLYRRALSGSANVAYIIDFRDTVQDENKIALYIDGSNYLTLYVAGAGRITSSVSLSLTTWYHIAIVRLSGTTTLYIDGINRGTWGDSTNYTQGQCWIAEYPLDNQYSLDGNIDEVRIVVGEAVWTKTFTPPTSQYPDI